MLTGKQLKIFGLFGRNTFKEYTFKELKEFSKEKSNSLMQNAISRFLKEQLITERKIGTSKLYKINHENDKVYDYLKICNLENLPKIVNKCLEIIKDEIDKEESFYALVIFGSYAKGTFTQKSDLDIAVFIKDKKAEKKLKIALNSASNKTLLNLDFHIITESDFLEMLKADYENLGKQIARVNLPVYNTVIFYKLIIKAIRYGFKVIS